MRENAQMHGAHGRFFELHSAFRQDPAFVTRWLIERWQGCMSSQPPIQMSDRALAGLEKIASRR